MAIFHLFADNPILLLPWFAALLIGITIHEFAHGFAAYKLGDDTAEKLGRLTLNPLAHIDPIGGIMLLLVGFGWAKPVPININKIKKGNLGRVIVSVAGVVFNVVMAIACLTIMKYYILDNFALTNLLTRFFAFLIYINLALFAFNLLPIPPLDGYHIIEYFFPKVFSRYSMFVEQWGMFILLIVVFMTNILGYVISYIVFFFSWIFNINIFILVFP